MQLARGARRAGFVTASRTLGPPLAAAGGGALYFLGYVGFGLWPLLFVFLVPFWRALEATRGRRVGATALAGAAFGAVAYVGGYPWLWRLVEVFLAGDTAVGALLWTLHGAYFAAGFVAVALLHRALRERGAGPALAGVAPLLTVEWLQPQLFPVHAGAGLVGAAPLVQIADLGGPLLLTAFVALGNVVSDAVWGWLRAQRPFPRRVAAGAVLGVLLVLGYGVLRTRALGDGAAAPGLRVGIVQANLGLLEKRRQGVQGHRQHLAQTRALLEAGPVDLVVWPETAYVRGLRRPLPLDGEPVREALRVPLLFGGTSVWEEDGRRVAANSALLVGADGTIRDAYDKNLLIPLAEHVPLGGIVPGLAGLFPHAQGFRASTSTPPLRLGALRIATPICYEAVRADFVRRMVREARPHLLVTLANDAWFGDSQEPWMHLALARLRAVEHRLWMVRATNSGVSAVIDPTGRVVARTGLLTRESLRATVHPRRSRTLYARVGDWPGPLGAVLVVGGLARRRRGAAVDGPRSPHASDAPSGAGER